MIIPQQKQFTTPQQTQKQNISTHSFIRSLHTYAITQHIIYVCNEPEAKHNKQQTINLEKLKSKARAKQGLGLEKAFREWDGDGFVGV